MQSPNAVLPLAERSATPREKRVSGALAALCLVLTVGVIPWASVPVAVDPRIALVADVAICIVDLCIALLLATAYRGNGRPALLVLTGVYVFGGVMAVLHAATFPGALAQEPLFGGAQTAGWLYLAWRGLSSVGYLSAMIFEAGFTPQMRTSRRDARLVLCVLVAGAVCGALAWVAMQPTSIEVMAGAQFTGVNELGIWFSVALCVATLAIIWVRRSYRDALYLWLALALVAAAADLVLGNVADARYTLGWSVSRVGFVVSSYLLLAYALGGLPPRRGAGATIATYGGAVGTALGAVLLRLVFDPWLGNDVLYVTLFGAVALGVWLGGAGAAVLTFFVGYWIVRVLYLAPSEVAPTRTNDIVQLALLGLSGALIIVLGEGMRRARDLHRASEEALRERALQLQRADANKSQFLAMLSHELRNPLAPLRNGLAILERKPDAPVVDNTLAMMGRQITQASRLIDDLLDVSRIDRGKIEFRKERVALDSILRSAVETAMPSIDAKGHQLAVHYPGRSLQVDGDPVRLAQVVGNLLSNAAKFTPSGGHIELMLRAEGDNALLSVKDNGTGIAREHLNDVFDMFMQIDTSRHASAGGLGLGLTLVRAIVAHHGGRVEARSAGIGQGTEFVVTLPLARAAATLAPPSTVTLTDLGRRILVVDDNVDAADTLTELLRLSGHVVETAYEGASALQRAEKVRPDLAFIDLNMPGIDGYELARQLRATSWGRTMTLVALTGMGQKTDIARTRDAGFDEHLTKPADPERLARVAGGTDRDENVVALRTKS